MSCIKDLKKLSANECFVLILIAASFISVYIASAMLFLLPFYILFTKQSKAFFPKEKYKYFLLIFVILGAVSTFLFSRNSDLFGTQIKSVYLKILSIAMFLLPIDIYCFSSMINKHSYQLSLIVAMAMSDICFIVALIQKIFKLYASADRPDRYASTFQNENYYGTMIVFAVLISLYVIYKNRSKSMRIFSLITIISNIIGLWFCQSRTAYITLAVSLVIFFSLINKKYIYISSGILITSAIIILIYPSLLPRFDSALNYLNYRFGIWKAALSCFSDNILIGRGYFAFCGICSEYCEDIKYYALHSHNMYIELLLNFGIIGTASLLIYIIKTVKESLKAIIHNCLKAELALMVSIIVAILILGLADITLFWPQTGIIAAYILLFPKIYESEN